MPKSVATEAPVSQAALAQASIPRADSQPASPAVPVGPLPSHLAAPAPVAQAQAVAAPAPTTAPQAPDPLAEAPQAKWYVRPPSGGQFGPAAADCMRRWLTEGRVSADSLVWREGWSDWKKSAEVFPEIGGVPAAPGVPAPPPPGGQAGGVEFPATATPVTGARPYRRKKSSNGMAVAMVVTLAVVAVGLLVGLMVVLNNS